MLQRFPIIFGAVLLSLLPCSALAAGSIPLSLWQPDAHDIFVVDVSQNNGYLIHENGEYVTFQVASGRKSTVHYIGRTYRADTPIRTWTAEQEQIKGDRRTFGVSGRFIRLFRDGENSPYGIHSYYKEDQWMNADGRYFSMGCILVTEEMMDIVEQTFTLTGKKLSVITTDDLQATLEKVTASRTSTMTAQKP